jgi:dienelactone hydrolase
MKATLLLAVISLRHSQLRRHRHISNYPDAGHAFENPNNNAGYRPDDATDAWKHTTDFLAKTSKK